MLSCRSMIVAASADSKLSSAYDTYVARTCGVGAYYSDICVVCLKVKTGLGNDAGSAQSRSRP
eukprot:6187706-Pleurochrysis_carterae.AAC.2